MQYDFYCNLPPKKTISQPLAVLHGTDYHGGRHILPLEDISLLCTGAAGSGKTCFIQNILPQTMQRANSIHVIFDPKGDYLKKFYKEGDCILSLKDLSNYPASTQPKWHLLKDMCLYEAHPEEQIREIAKTLFQKVIEENHSNPYFPTAACNLFSALMIAMCRQYADRLPSTREAIQKIRSMSIKEMLNATNQYADLASTRQLIVSDAPQTVGGVMGEFINVLEESFQGNFCGEGTFSLREFIRHGGIGRKLFIEYEFDTKKSSETMIRIILDLLMKETLTGKSEAERIYFYLDEFPQLPGKLTYLSDLVNFGRQYGVRAISGIQSVAQLYASWGEKEANALLAGFINTICFFCNDTDSREYFSKHAGEADLPITKMNPDFTVYTAIEKQPLVPSYILTQLSVGDAVVFERKKADETANQYPYWIHFDKEWIV